MAKSKQSKIKKSLASFDKFFVLPEDDEPENQDQLVKDKYNLLDRDDWYDLGYEGQLAVDIFEKDNNIIVRSAIAGVKPKDIDIIIKNDMLTIRGQRQSQEQIKEENYFLKECHWGSFSRSIILPVEIDIDNVTSEISNGILTITLPKLHKKTTVKLKPVQKE